MNAYPSNYIVVRVNALSGLYLISTNVYDYIAVTHYIEGVNALSGLYLISTGGISRRSLILIIVSMPSRAYTSFLQRWNRCRSNDSVNVSMPSRAYTSFLRQIIII